MSDEMRVPKFQLEKVYSNGRREEPQLHVLSDIDVNCRMGRRGFLLTSALGAGALAALSSGCLSSGSVLNPYNNDFSKVKITPNAVSAEYAPDIAAHFRPALALAFSPDGRLLASAAVDSAVKIWSMPDGKLLNTLKPASSARHLAFTPDGKRLVAGEFGGVTSFWEAPFKGERKKLPRNDGVDSAMSLGPDGAMVAVNKGRTAIHLLSVPEGKVVREFGQAAEYLDFSPDGTMLAASGEGKVTLYTMPSGRSIKQWEEFCEAQAISSDGKILAIRYNLAFGLWSMPSGKLIRVEAVYFAHGHAALAFSPDGKWLGVGANDSKQMGLLLYRAPFAEQAFFLALKSDVRALAFSKDGRFLAVSAGGCILLWEMPKGQEAPKFLFSLFDPAATQKNVSARQANIEGSTYVGPCGSPLPAGAICTCNCVPGSYTPPPLAPYSPPASGGGTYCTCNKICTCVPIK